MGGWGDGGSHVFGITGGGISVFGDQVRWGLSFLELGWGGGGASVVGFRWEESSTFWRLFKFRVRLRVCVSS